MRTFMSRLPVVALSLLISWGGVAYGDAMLSDADVQKIEQLIASVERLTDARFIRNGKAYSAKNAARFLRGKWRARKDEVRSVHDFIAKVGSHSSTSGKPYRIRFADGREIPAAEFLRAQLANDKRR